ncbi:MAG TPA: WYL domain-containing protein [Acidimicrobiales bacterium]|nr:WYL domain-containing protein [Acidimicrobiales bacterium]
MTRLDAGERLRRLLAVLAWLARRGRAPVSELSERFGISPEDLISDLELAACCGLPPYTPDQLMEIMVDEIEVVANLAPELARPRRLSSAEGFALAAAARAILSVPGSDTDGALSGALTKLDKALELDRLRVELDDPPHLEEVQQAVYAGRQVELEYHSSSRDEVSRRLVDPGSLVALDGHWYLDGWCHRAGGVRRFRVDRILSLQSTDVASCHSVAGDGGEGSETRLPAPFVPGPEATVVRLSVDEAGAWISDAVPTLEVSPWSDGRREVTLAIVSDVWFGRLLMRLGPHARVVDPPELAAAGAKEAKRVLARYEVDARH